MENTVSDENIKEQKPNFTLDRVKELLAMKDMPEISEVSLQVLQTYYENEILPYKYRYECNNGLTLDFFVEKSEFCHLLLGSVDKLVSDPNTYKGVKGYDNIKNNVVTIDNLPSKIKDSARYRIKSFIFLPLLLKNPQIIYFNKHISNTQIPADFLLYKTFEKIKMHFFLKTINNKTGHLACLSFFHNEGDKYISNQIKLKVKNVIIAENIKLKEATT